MLPAATAVHPRGRGEHYTDTGTAFLCGGSSPRARGTRRADGQTIKRSRFIPAGAGNTPSAATTTSRPTVHPRGCGEHQRHSFPRSFVTGSSPRVRGTRTRCRVFPARFRFIPAGAGNTRRFKNPVMLTTVHPRGCGEHSRISPGSPGCFGSSPRVRGTPGQQHGDYCQARFIPAGAGNTPPMASSTPRRAVHPRGCGEHSAPSAPCVRPGGSSPRVRGTPSAHAIQNGLVRFIPAGAGNTAFTSRKIGSTSVHPRGCGEHT